MAFYPGMTPLRDVLAELYPAASIARAVVGEVGLAEQLIDFNGSAVEFWKNILSVAQNNGQVQDVIDVARGHFPKNRRLTEAETIFHTAPQPISNQDENQMPHQGSVVISGQNHSIQVGGDIVGGNKLVVTQSKPIFPDLEGFPIRSDHDAIDRMIRTLIVGLQPLKTVDGDVGANARHVISTAESMVGNSGGVRHSSKKLASLLSEIEAVLKRVKSQGFENAVDFSKIALDSEAIRRLLS